MSLLVVEIRVKTHAETLMRNFVVFVQFVQILESHLRLLRLKFWVKYHMVKLLSPHFVAKGVHGFIFNFRRETVKAREINPVHFGAVRRKSLVLISEKVGLRSVYHLLRDQPVEVVIALKLLLDGPTAWRAIQF